MPDENSKTEATLADLAVNLVLGRTPALADHYLGFDLIPGSVNETKTRAAGLLGFRIGQETVCIPVLFLNGKVKGTEVLYMEDPDVFTSNSRQWISYLLSRDSASMGAGTKQRTPVAQVGGSAGMRVFSRNPGSLAKSAFFEETAKNFWEKIASPVPEAADLYSNPNFTLKNVLRSLGKEAYLKFAKVLDENPEVLAKIANVIPVDEFLINDWPEEKVAAAQEVFDPFGGDTEIVCIRSSDLFDDRLSKTAAITALPQADKERCLRDGLLFIDKRASDDTTLIAREEYRHRFSAPSRDGFYEILNQGGELEKVFVAQNPFMIESPARSMPGFLVLDPESGVFVAPPAGQQVFVRSEFVTDEAIWKEKFRGMAQVSSAEVNKSYVLVSPSMRVSAPFRVSGKVKAGDDMHLICETPWEYKFRSNTPVSDCCVTAGCGSSGENGMVKIVENENESRVARIGNITFVPSSWRLQEVYGDSTSLEYSSDYVPPQESSSEKKKREGRIEKRKAYLRILPGDSRTLNALTFDKDQFKLTLKKEASSHYSLGIGKLSARMTRNGAMESLVMELDLPIGKAAALLDEADGGTEVKAFLVFKGAGFDDVTKALGRGIDGLVQGVDNAIETPAETNKIVTSGLLGAGAGGLAGAAAGFALPAMAGRYLGGEAGASTSSDPETSARRKRIGALLGVIGGGLVGIPGAYFGGMAGAAGGTLAGAAIGDKLASKTASKDPFVQWASRKVAHGMNQDGVIYQGMPIPDLSTEMGPNISGVNEQTGSFANEIIPLNSMRDPADDWRDPDFANWDKIQSKDLDFLMRVADSGSKQVLESSMINLLLKTNRVSHQIEEWLPDLVNSLDSKCRLLLTFYWHSKNFADDYGKDEMAAFEDVLLNAIKVDGQIVLFLKQGSGQSSFAQVNPFD